MKNTSLKYCPKAKKERKRKRRKESKKERKERKLAEDQLTSGLLVDKNRFSISTSSKQCHVIIDDKRHFGSVFLLRISTLES